LVKFIWKANRTYLGTVSTSCAFIRIYIACLLVYPDLEVSFLPVYVLYLRQGKYLDVQVPADLDQFR
jgi:hypothetical protein